MAKTHQRSIPELHVASEAEPFSKTGGLGSALGSLPRAQRTLGVDAIIITPYYEGAYRCRPYRSI